MTISKPITVVAAMLLLAACGGGGGGGAASNGGPTGPTVPVPDTVVFGDALVVAQGQLFRPDSSCNASACTVTFQGERATIDLLDIDPNAPDVTVTDQQTRNGVQTGRATAGDKLNFNTFGVWGTYNTGTPLRGSTILQGMDVQFAFPVSLGMVSGSNPISGSATWTGAMAGVRIGSSSLGAEVIGDAEMIADLAAESLDLAFTNIADTSGVLGNDIRWQGVSMENGSFQTTGLDGRFYGPDHEEAGGVFERDGIAGAFSLTRQ